MSVSHISHPENLPSNLELQLSCFECNFSEPVNWAALGLDEVDAYPLVPVLLERGALHCPQCGSVYLMFAGVGADKKNHLILSRSPYSTGELRTIKNTVLLGSKDSIFIPYGMDGKEASKRSPYLDLSVSPELIDSIPEAVSAKTKSQEFNGANSFYKLIESVNLGSTFATLGCAWESNMLDGDYLTYGYIDLVMRPLEENTYSRVRDLAERLQSILSQSARINTKYMLALKQGIFNQKPIFVLDIEVIAADSEEHKSFLLWETLLVDLNKLLVYKPQIFLAK